jgi:hypothetical protein
VPERVWGFKSPLGHRSLRIFLGFSIRLNTWPCNLPFQAILSGLRGQAALRVPGWAGNPPQARLLTASADHVASYGAASAASRLRCGLQSGDQVLPTAPRVHVGSPRDRAASLDYFQIR